MWRILTITMMALCAPRTLHAFMFSKPPRLSLTRKYVSLHAMRGAMLPSVEEAEFGEKSVLHEEGGDEIAEMTFENWDTNQDGNISPEELRNGLERTFLIDVTEEDARDLMYIFDSSGDGLLQRNEFADLEEFRYKLHSLIQKERRQDESPAVELNVNNNCSPSAADKIFSVLPYALPLLDGLVYSRFLLQGVTAGSRLAIAALSGIYSFYHSIPKTALFVLFLGLNLLSHKPSLHPLVRFNIQQAMFLDIALLLPGLMTATMKAMGASGFDLELPVFVLQLANEVVFITVLCSVAYSIGTSLIGSIPDQVPFVSGAVRRKLGRAQSRP